MRRCCLIRIYEPCADREFKTLLQLLSYCMLKLFVEAGHFGPDLSMTGFDEAWSLLLKGKCRLSIVSPWESHQCATLRFDSKCQHQADDLNLNEQAVRLAFHLLTCLGFTQEQFCSSSSLSSSPIALSLRSYLYRSRCTGFRLAPPKIGWQCWFVGFRFGEAQNPGPSQIDATTRVRFTTLNPTAIFQKESVLTEIGHEVYLLSENSATATVQAKMNHTLRQCGFQSIWGHPAPPHRVDVDADADNQYIRGAPVGVSIHSSFPLIPSRVESEQDWVQVGRLFRGYVQIGHWQIQLIVLYGLQASQPSAKDRTDQLLQAAARMALEVNIPTIIGGDLNHRPSHLATWKTLQAHGWSETGLLHEQMYGTPLPPTYLQNTTPDVIMISPDLLPHVKNVTVDHSGWVAGHHPLTVELHLPFSTPLKTTWRLPKSWIPFDPQQNLFNKQYVRRSFTPQEFERVKEEPSWGIRTWSKRIEQSVHFAIADHHASDPFRQPFTGLPKAAQGRCQFPKIVQTPVQTNIKKAWHGHWTPDLDFGSIKLKQFLKQLRRIQSLKFRVRKLTTFAEVWSSTWLQLAEEWTAIQKAPGFFRGFNYWQQRPEAPTISTSFPTEAQLFDLEQLLKFEIEIMTKTERKRQRDLHQYHQWFDVREGHKKKLFHSVRERSTGILCHLTASHKSEANLIRNEGTGLVELQLANPLPLRLDLPLYLNNNQATLIHYEFPLLEAVIDDADADLPFCLEIEQKAPTAEPKMVGQILASYWNRYWRRDSKEEQTSLEPWTDFAELFEQLPPPLQLSKDELDLPIWREAIMSVASGSSRGACGWFPDELKMVASCDIALADLMNLMKILTAIPTWLMQARIIPTKKVPDATQPGQVRPITVLPLYYRIWGKAVAKLVLREWTRTWPPDVTGFLPHRHAEHMVYHVQHELEKIHSGYSPHEMGGVTMDIIKCFNQLPHKPIESLMIAFGVPQWATNFWFQSISAMARWWQIQGGLIPAGLGTTGLPEGDPMSVVGQLCLNRLWVFFLAKPQIIINAYADNWSYASFSPRLHRGAITATMKVTKALKLEVDWMKTWCWGTSKSHLHALKAAAHQYLPSEVKLAKASNARELGYIMHYRRLPFRGTQKQRHEQSKARLKRLEKQEASLQATAQVAQQSAITKALFGVHFYVPAERYFSELRTAVAQAMIPGANLNPYLPLLALTDRVIDPELYVIQQALRAARRYLNNVHPTTQEQFLALAARRPLAANQIFGPAMALRHYLARIGWTIDRQGNLHIDSFLTLSLQYGDIASILHYSTIAWATTVSERLTRENWRNAPIIDFATTRALFSKIPEEDQRLLAREICGGFLYQGQKGKFDEHVTDECLLCQQPDGPAHRVLHCPATAECRAQHAWVTQQLEEHDPIHVHLPVCFADHLQAFVRLHQHRPLDIAWTDHPRKLDGPRIFYTDGSCQHPQWPHHRWAAFAIVEQVCDPSNFSTLQLIEQMKQPQHLKIAAIGTCPGKQTIPRAELEALIQITMRCPYAIICTDSAFAIEQMRLFEELPDWSALAMKPGTDQLRRLFLLRSNSDTWPTLRKVKAHQHPAHCTTLAQIVDLVGNAYADETAKMAARTLGGPLLKQQKTLLEEHLSMTTMLKANWDLRIAQGKIRAKLLKADEEADQQPGLTSVLSKFSSWQPTEPSVLFNSAIWDERYFLASYWGPRFSMLVWQWLRLLRWPTTLEASHRKAPVGITWLELATNCWICTQHPIPVNVNKYPQPPNYVSPVDTPGFELKQTTLLAMADSLSKCVRQLAKFSNEPLLPLEHSRTVRSLQTLAGTRQHYGLALRPELPLQRETMTCLYTWLRADNSTPFPEIPILDRPPIEVHTSLQRLNPAAQNTLYQLLLRKRREKRSHN